MSAPDLVVTNLAIDQPSPLTGAQITVTWTDANIGTSAISGGWFDRIRIVNQTTGAVLMDQLVRYDLPAGTLLQPVGEISHSVVYRIPDGNAGAGNLRIQITTDAANGVTEVNAGGTGESNNTTFIDVTSLLAAYPDLQVTDLTITPAPGWGPGTLVSVSWTTRNQGNVATSGSWVETVNVLNLTTGQSLFNVLVPYDATTGGAIAARDRAAAASRSRGRPAQSVSVSSGSPSRRTARPR